MGFWVLFNSKAIVVETAKIHVKALVKLFRMIWRHSLWIETSIFIALCGQHEACRSPGWLRSFPFDSFSDGIPECQDDDHHIHFPHHRSRSGWSMFRSIHCYPNLAVDTFLLKSRWKTKWAGSRRWIYLSACILYSTVFRCSPIRVIQ